MGYVHQLQHHVRIHWSNQRRCVCHSIGGGLAHLEAVVALAQPTTMDGPKLCTRLGFNAVALVAHVGSQFGRSRTETKAFLFVQKCQWQFNVERGVLVPRFWTKVRRQSRWIGQNNGDDLFKLSTGRPHAIDHSRTVGHCFEGRHFSGATRCWFVMDRGHATTNSNGRINTTAFHAVWIVQEHWTNHGESVLPPCTVRWLQYKQYRPRIERRSCNQAQKPSIEMWSSKCVASNVGCEKRHVVFDQGVTWTGEEKVLSVEKVKQRCFRV